MRYAFILRVSFLWIDDPLQSLIRLYVLATDVLDNRQFLGAFNNGRSVEVEILFENNVTWISPLSVLNSM